MTTLSANGNTSTSGLDSTRQLLTQSGRFGSLGGAFLRICDLPTSISAQLDLHISY